VTLPPGFDAQQLRAVAMDLDHTILGDSLEFRSPLVKAVRAVHEAGVEPIVATGRMFASARPYALELGVQAPVICYQGALIADPTTGEWLRHEPLEVALARQVIRFVAAAGFHMNVYVDDRLYVEALNEEAIRYATHARLQAHPVGDLERWLEHPTTKIVVVGDPKALDDLELAMRGEFGGRLFIAKSLPFFLEIARPGVSKGAALHFVCDYLAIDPADTVSFGDGANDVELLRDAGLGVAVEGADPALAAVAGWTVPGVEQDGVATFLAAIVSARCSTPG
jgi:Cof subfamily protein (haloacid dehalogenase superfamily)